MASVRAAYCLPNAAQAVGKERKRKLDVECVLTKPEATLPTRSNHVADCRRYRDKMTRKFDELTRTVLGTETVVSMNHRAKVIDHTMGVLKQLMEETTNLQLELAMTDKRRMSKWIEKAVSAQRDIGGATLPILELFTAKRGWKYAELWTVDASTGSLPIAELGRGVFAPGLDKGTRHFFEDLKRKHIAEVVPLKCGLLSQCYETMYTQCMSRPSCVLKDAAPSVQMCMAVPIIIFGHVRAIAAFYDTQWREEEARDGLKVAESATTIVGNVYGTMYREVVVQTKRGSEQSSLSFLSSGSDGISLPSETDEPTMKHKRLAH